MKEKNQNAQIKRLFSVSFNSTVFSVSESAIQQQNVCLFFFFLLSFI